MNVRLEVAGQEVSLCCDNGQGHHLLAVVTVDGLWFHCRRCRDKVRVPWGTLIRAQARACSVTPPGRQEEMLHACPDLVYNDR